MTIRVRFIVLITISTLHVAVKNVLAQTETKNTKSQDYLTMKADFYNCFGPTQDSSCFDRCLMMRSRSLIKRDTFTYIQSYILESRLYDKFNQYDKAVSICYFAYKAFCKTDNFTRFCGPCWNLNEMLSTYQAKMGRIKEAIRTRLEPRSANCLSPIELIVNDVAVARYLIQDKNLDSAKSVIDSMIRTAESLNDTSERIAGYSNVALISHDAGLYYQAIDLFKHSIRLIDSCKINEPLKPIAMGNIGHSYYKLGELDSAYKYLLYDSNESRNYDLWASHTGAELLLAEIDFMNNRTNLCVERLRKIEQSELTGYLSEKYRNQFLDLSFRAELKLATDPIRLRKIISIKEEIDSSVQAENTRKNTLLSSYTKNIYDQSLSKHRNRRLILKKNYDLVLERGKRRKWQVTFILAFACLIILLAPIIVLRYRKQKNKHRLFERQKTLLIQEQLLLKEAREELLELRLKEKQKETSALSMELFDKVQFAEKLIIKLKKIKIKIQ